MPSNYRRKNLILLEDDILAALTHLWGLAMERKYNLAVKREWGEFQDLLSTYFAEVKKRR